jgi:YfiH family protein
MTAVTSPILEGAGFPHEFGTRITNRADSLPPIHILMQVHGERIVVLDQESDKRIQNPKSKIQKFNPNVVFRELPEEAFRFDEGDALIISLPGVNIGIRTADCLPVLLADPVSGTVAAVHCGWRSLALDLAEQTVQTMTSLAGNKPSGLIAALGPAINTCCYEVGSEVIGQFQGYDADPAAYTEREDRFYLNLRAIALSQLLRAGLSPDHIDDLAQCTSCLSERYFSHRARRDEGRMVSFIQAKG